MPERSNDRLESFFKKVSGRPDISFNEDDWKKLEARLDEKETRSSISRRNRNRIGGATVVILLLIGGLFWLSQPEVAVTGDATSENNIETPSINSAAADIKATPPITQTDVAESNDNKTASQVSRLSDLPEQKAYKESEEASVASTKSVVVNNGILREDKVIAQSSISGKPGPNNEATQTSIDEPGEGRGIDVFVPVVIAPQVDDKNDMNEIKISPAIADKTKQKANMADSVVKEKNDVNVKDAYGSGLTEHPASPRLSLLLSIAPDFSTVAFDYYTDPGQAIGLMLHYHVKRSWSFATGAVLSRKKYVGDGEDYTPPKSYWQINTNGIIPETIDGKCSVLEIPLMIQYAIINKGKNKFLVGAGTSSYIMLDESYKYNFEYPNPGAKQGWSSKGRSTLFFNVINVTAGFERRIFPGFTMGIEPYLKIPLEGIGWSDLKLYSAGASLTMRYIIINQKNPISGN